MPSLLPLDHYLDQLPRHPAGQIKLGPYRGLEPLPAALPSWDTPTWNDVAEHWQHQGLEGTPLPNVMPPGKLPVRNRPHDLYQQLNPARPDASLGMSPLALNEALRQAVEPFSNAPSVPTLMRQEISVMLLLARGARCTDEALTRAVLTGNLRLVHRLLAHRTTPAWDHEPGTFRDSPLLSHAAQGPVWAAESSGVMARMLLDAGASPHTQDKDQRRTALHWAAANRRVQVVRALLDAGADANAPNGQGHTPVHYAAARNDVASLQALIEHGGDLRRHVPVPELLSVGRRVTLSFETPHLARPTDDDANSTWVVPSFIPAPRPRQARLQPLPGYAPTGAPSGTIHSPGWAVFAQPKPTVIPSDRVWLDTPMTQAAYAGANESIEWLMKQGIEPCPPLNPRQPDGPRDERVLALLEGAGRRACEDDHQDVQDQVVQARVVVERTLLKTLDPLAVLPNAPLNPTVRSRSRL